MIFYFLSFEQNKTKQSPFTMSNTGKSIITSNACQINLSNENVKINTVSEIVAQRNSFWHFNLHFVLKRFQIHLHLGAFVYEVRCFLGIFDLPTYPNQILY